MASPPASEGAQLLWRLRKNCGGDEGMEAREPTLYSRRGGSEVARRLPQRSAASACARSRRPSLDNNQQKQEALNAVCVLKINVPASTLGITQPVCIRWNGGYSR